MLRGSVIPRSCSLGGQASGAGACGQDRSSEAGSATACAARGGDFIPATHRLARLVRPPSPAAAVAGGAAASAPIPTASGSPRSCCNRRRSRRSRPITPASWRVGPMSRALAAAPLEEVLQDLGRARLLRPRPQPACLRPRRGRAAWRKISRRARRRCARFPASAPTPPRRSPRLRSMRRRARSTAISSA